MRTRESSSIIAKLEQAEALYAEGRLAQAEALSQEVLRRYPWHFEALRLGSLIALKRGDGDTARRLIEKALHIDPGKAIGHFNHGNALRALNLPAEALHSYQRALALKPNDVDTLVSRADTLCTLGRYPEAVDSYGKALRLRPDDIDALAGCGRALLALGRHADALPKLEQALAQRPDHLDALHDQAQALLRAGRLDDAFASYEQLLQHRLPDAAMLEDIGGIALGLGRMEEALAACDEALQMEPERALSHCHRGQALLALGRPADALAACDEALRLRPGLIEAISNRGLALMRLARHREALDCHAAVLRRRGEDAWSEWHEALCRLMLGDYGPGWEKYESRWRLPALRERLPDIAAPCWQPGQAVHGKRVLLQHEQGLGDMLQFVRYAPRVAALGAEVLAVVPRPLQRLISGMPGVARAIPAGEALPAFDLWCPMLSLPRLFDARPETIAAGDPYLRAHANDVRYWQERLARDSAAPGLRIGLAWADEAAGDGAPFATAGEWRPDVDAQLLAPLTRLAGATFYSLQGGQSGKEAHAAGMRVIDHTRMIGNFADLAALIMNLDLVISTDHPVAHLAGALGKPVWLLNGFAGSWRWQQGRADSPWYPSLRLFRQPRAGDWESVVAEVGRELRKQVESNLSTDTPVPWTAARLVMG